MSDTKDQYRRALDVGDMPTAALLAAQLDAEDDATVQRLARPDALHKAALYYARKGIRVFPCQPMGKKPLTLSGFKDATTDVMHINRWWAEYPTANIGAPTGLVNGFDVIDIDDMDGALMMFGEQRMVDSLPLIGHATTSRLGGHHLFIEPQDRGNGTHLFGTGIDYRGNGGYVVLAPSMGETGRRYAWLTPLSLING